MSAKRINFRCRPSTFRALLDSISEHFTKEVVEILRMLHIHQFIRMPATQQDSTDITLLMSCWNIEKQAFYVGGHYLPFTADEVALIIGMPNRGEKVTWQKSPLSESNSICFKNKIKKLDRPLSAAQFVQLYIQFLISNLFFIYHNYRVASDLISYADNIDKFANYNWPEAIWSFLVSQFDMITTKILTQKAPGYMSGFVTLLMIWFLEHTRVLSPTVPSAKPRMLRWSNIKFTEESISGLQGDQGHHEMKRSFPWKTVDFISLSDSDSDSEGDRQDRAKRGKKDYSSKNLKDITSEGALIRMAGMYQDYMKRTPIPTFSGSVIPFTSWQGLANSLKQLYGQPLHYLTNRLLKQWDRERFGSDDEHQPLDAVIHPLKAQTLIWLTEELHRLTASPHHLAELWASDPMYHSFIDPFLSC